MVCKTCGADLPDSAVFCPSCGSWAAEKPPLKAASQQPGEEFPDWEATAQESKIQLFWKDKKKRNLLLSALLVVAAALSLAVSMILDNPHLSPSNVILSFTDASYRQNEQQFLELLPPGTEEILEPSAEQAALYSAMNNFWSGLEGTYQCRVVALNAITGSSLERIQDYYQESCTVLQAQTATVETTYSLYGNSISVENEVVVIQTQDGWYLDWYYNFVLGVGSL